MDAKGGDAGGTLGRDFLMFAGAAATYGVAPTAVLRADPDELAALAAIVTHAVDYQQHRDTALARRVVVELAEAMKRGR